MKNVTATNKADVIEEEFEATPKQLAKILDLAREQKKLINKKNKLEADLEQVKKDLNTNKTVLLPKAMDAAHKEECPLGEKGWKVEAWTEVRANIPSPDNDKVENAEELNKAGIAYADKACPDLVQNQFIAIFPKGSEKFFRKFMADMKKRKVQIEYSVRRTVNPQTLSKWVRDQDKLGKSVDEVALRVHRRRIAEVVGPKK
jgi:translation elongation factor EF-G